MDSFASIIFVTATLVVGYVLIGYPLLLALLSTLEAGTEHARRSWRPAVSVLMAVRNGAPWLDAKLTSLRALDYPEALLETIVIDDGSTDETAAILARWRDRRVIVVTIPPGGKAAALSAGLAIARGEVLFFTDVRQRIDPSALVALVEHLADPGVGVVSGELVIGRGTTREQGNIGLYWRYEKWIRRRLSALDSVIGATGCIYAMKRSLAAPLPAGVILDDVYLPLLAFFKGYRVIFTGDALAYDEPAGLETEFRRKVRTLAGNYQLLRYFPQLLLPTNRMWLHFLSHKIGRLLLPFALVAIAGSTPWLPGPLSGMSAAAQALVYGLAAADWWLPASTRLRRLTSPARTFVVLMAASAMALPVAIIGPTRFWTPTGTSHGARAS